MTHEERHRELVERIAVGLKPVRLPWPEGARLGFWLLLEGAMLAWVVAHTTNDFMLRLYWPSYTLEIVIFAAAAVLAARLALRSAIPGRAVSPSEVVLVTILVAAGTALLAGFPVRTSYPLGEFIRQGVTCASITCLLAAPPWIALAWAVKRLAPMRGALSGALVGASALLFSFAIMRIYCPLDEPLHLITWHLLPVLGVTALSGLIGVFWLRFRPPLSGRIPIS